ncbi:MAG TPA: PDZ domain-containing protein [Solirubrobacteraceae bacterium]|jgi:hypothetical protein
MSGPKHLWSGDWENESEDATARIAPRPRPRDPEPETPAAPPPARERSRPRRAVRPWVVPLALGVVVLAAAAYGLTQLGGSSSPAPGGQGPTAVATRLNKPKLTGSTAPIRWLGMEIITAPQGVPVVETVRPGSNGDQAGLEPGDAILLVNNRPVGTSGSIATAIKGMHSGDHVPLEITNGGAMFQVIATLAAPPSPYP